MKKISTLIIIVLSIVLIFVFGYVGYGSTMINPDNEQSIINVLSTDKSNPINILATKKYGDRFLVLYTDPVKVKENENSSCFSTFVKNKFYKNRNTGRGHRTRGCFFAKRHKSFCYCKCSYRRNQMQYIWNWPRNRSIY